MRTLRHNHNIGLVCVSPWARVIYGSCVPTHLQREKRNHQTFHIIIQNVYVFNVPGIELSFVNTVSVTVEFDNCNGLNNQWLVQ